MAGYLGGRVDAILMRIADVQLSFSTLMAAIIVGASVRAEKKREYVDAAKVMGFSTPRIMFWQILPNTLSPIFVIGTVQIANAIISEAALAVVEHFGTRVAVMYLGRVCKLAEAKTLFSTPRYPYTQALLPSVADAPAQPVKSCVSPAGRITWQWQICWLSQPELL